jgi:hypothetical protein
MSLTRRRLFATLAVLVLGLIVLGFNVLTVSGTAESVARAMPEVPGSYHELGQIGWSHGTLTLYTVGRYRYFSHGPIYTTLGVVFADHPLSVGFDGGTVWEDVNRIGDVESLTNRHDLDWVVAGRVLDRGVRAIELRSPVSGRTMRIPVRRDRLFGVVIVGWDQFFPDGREFQR